MTTAEANQQVFEFQISLLLGVMAQLIAGLFILLIEYKYLPLLFFL